MMRSLKFCLEMTALCRRVGRSMCMVLLLYVSTAQATSADEGRYIIRVNSEIQISEAITQIQELAVVGVQLIAYIPDDNSVVVRLRPEDVSMLAAHPAIERVEVDRQVRVLFETNDPFFDQQYSLQGPSSSNVTDAWNTTIGAESALVAIIDTGADLAHPDLKPSLWVNPREIPGNGRDDDRNGYIDDMHGCDVVNRDGSPQDDNGHGTHVTGTVAAAGDNSIGGVGVAWGSRVIVVKALAADGVGFSSDLVKAIDYVTSLKKRGVPVVAINVSLGGSQFSGAVLRAIQRARNRDILLVAAAGNDGDDNNTTSSYPANFRVDSVLSVAATNTSGELAEYSNYGSKSVHVAAPGSQIVGTYPVSKGSYRVLSGTSMASPHVAGIIALVASANPELSALQIRSILLSTIQPRASLLATTIRGGMTDARAAIDEALVTRGLARLTGTVRDRRRRAISDARVLVRSREAPSQRLSAMTTTDGSYSVSRLSPGRYRVTVSKRGRRFRGSNLTVSGVSVLQRNFSAR